MSQVATVLKQGTQRLKEAGVASANLDCRVLLGAALKKSYEEVFASPNYQLSSLEAANFEAYLKRREKREPVSRILGEREFWSLSFLLSEETLDPRPDSETLIEATLGVFSNKIAPLKILDFGTGSGCLLLSLLHEYPNATGVGVDINEDTLKTAQLNAQNIGVSSRASFVKSDWGASVIGKYDVIVSNPPYIDEADKNILAPEVVEYDPERALFADKKGLGAYEILMPQIANLLLEDGSAFLEIGYDQKQDVEKIVVEAGLRLRGVFKDLGNIERCLWVSK